MKSLSYIQRETSEQRVRNTWADLVQFVNSTLPDPEATQSLAAVLARCTPARILDPRRNKYLRRVIAEGRLSKRLPENALAYAEFKRSLPPGLPLEFHEQCRDIRELGDDVNGWLERFEAGALSHQQELRNCVTWCVQPERHPELHGEVLALLAKANRARQELGMFPTNFDESSREYAPLYFARLGGYETIADPIALFILGELDKFHASDRTEHSRKKLVPLETCRRCGNLMLVQRVGKEFCSESCYYAAYNRDRDRVKRRNYMQKHRKDERERQKRKLGEAIKANLDATYRQLEKLTGIPVARVQKVAKQIGWEKQGVRWVKMKKPRLSAKKR